jgi:hypothetical protein
MGVGEIAERRVYATVLEAYGVRVRLEADDPKIFERVRAISSAAFVNRVRFFDSPEADFELSYKFSTDKGGQVRYDLDGLRTGIYKESVSFSRYLNSMIRAHVAAKTNSWIFIHAGVVEWRGRAIILPGQSHHGKSTLVSELIRIGAGYMSDEFAILDEDGYVHPFDRDLAMRYPGEEVQVDVPPGEFGSKRVTGSLPVGMVLFTKFSESGAWRPEKISVGNGIIAAIPQVIPVSFNTKFALKVLNTTFNRAIIIKSDRGEAKETAPRILEYFDESI